MIFQSKIYSLSYLDIIHRSYNRKIIYRGELILTKYRLLFVTKSPDPIQVRIESVKFSYSFHFVEDFGQCTDRDDRSDGESWWTNA